MDRRTFACRVASGISILPLTVIAQQSTKVSRIGYLRRTSPEPADIAAFRLGMRELGFGEGQNLIIDERYANGDATRLPELARELVQLKVHILVVDSDTTVRAARNVAGATPIVMAIGGDPVAAGLVDSLARPGGTITGLTVLGGELGPKRLQLLHEIVPATRVGFLFNGTNDPTSPGLLAARERFTGAARSLGIELIRVEATNQGELAGAFAKLHQASVGAVFVDGDAMFFSQRARVVDLAAMHKLPAVYAEREFVDAGGLMAYAPNGTVNFRRAAAYVDKILKGAKPGDLAIEQATRIELVINLKTAKALGIAIPQSVLSRADEVIR